MDLALKREREAFKRKAFAIPVVENRKSVVENNKIKLENLSEKDWNQASTKNNFLQINANNYKKVAPTPQYKSGVLVKIVQYLKNLYLTNGVDHPLSLLEILDATNQLDVKSKIIEWLTQEALPNNPKIEVTCDGKFLFRPPYKIRDRKGLLNLLRNSDLKGFGGILLEDIKESLPNWEKNLKSLEEHILYVSLSDKKKVLFYNDKNHLLSIGEDVRQLWRSVAIDGMDDNKIEEFLEKQGISKMVDTVTNKVLPKRKKRKVNPKKKVFKKPRDNEHLADVLEDYGLP